MLAYLAQLGKQGPHHTLMAHAKLTQAYCVWSTYILHRHTYIHTPVWSSATHSQWTAQKLERAVHLNGCGPHVQCATAVGNTHTTWKWQAQNVKQVHKGSLPVKRIYSCTYITLRLSVAVQRGNCLVIIHLQFCLYKWLPTWNYSVVKIMVSH